MRCEDADGLIDAFVEDALPRASQSELAAHVEKCARCRLAVEASRRLSAALSRLPSAAPSAAADARALAVVEEERAWTRRRAWIRRASVACAAVAVVAVVLFGVFVATPASASMNGAAATLLRAGESWLRLRALPAVFEARGTIAAAFVLFVVVAAIDRAMSRNAPQRPASA